jgi:hypothetical protein
MLSAIPIAIADVRCIDVIPTDPFERVYKVGWRGESVWRRSPATTESSWRDKPPRAARFLWIDVSLRSLAAISTALPEGGVA